MYKVSSEGDVNDVKFVVNSGVIEGSKFESSLKL